MIHFIPASRRHRVTIVGRFPPAHVAIVFRDTEYARAVEEYEQRRTELEQRQATAPGGDLKSSLGKIAQQLRQARPMHPWEIAIAMQRKGFITQVMVLTGCTGDRAQQLYEECVSEWDPSSPPFANVLRYKLDRLALGTLRL